MAHENLAEITRRAGDNRFSTFSEHVVTSYHVGCHLDGLGHAGIDGRYYNGLHYSEIFTATGLAQLGIENVRPWGSAAVSCSTSPGYGGWSELWAREPQRYAAAEPGLDAEA